MKTVKLVLDMLPETRELIESMCEQSGEESLTEFFRSVLSMYMFCLDRERAGGKFYIEDTNGARTLLEIARRKPEKIRHLRVVK